MKSEFTACVRNQKPVNFFKQSKIKEVQLRKTLLDQVKKGSQFQELQWTCWVINSQELF